MKGSNTKRHKAVVELLSRVGARYGKAEPSYFRSGLTFIASMPVSVQRALSLHESLQFSDREEGWRFWEHVFLTSKVFEVKSQAIHFAERDKGMLTLDHWKRLKKWVQGVENWAHSDSLSGLYAELFEKFPKELHKTYLAWNKSQNPWERRASVVGLFYYSSLRKNRKPSFKYVMKFLTPLFEDEHFYVQRGVGWTLRELYNCYPRETLKVLFEHAPTLSPHALQAATEKLPPKEKKRFMALRGTTRDRR